MIFKLLIFFSCFAAFFVTVRTTTTIICPKQEDAVILLGTTNVSVVAEPYTQRIRTGRLPPVGFYDAAISCILIVDITYDASAGTVQVINGGFNQRYVEVKLTSKIGMGLNYVIQAYSKAANLQTNSSLIH